MRRPASRYRMRHRPTLTATPGASPSAGRSAVCRSDHRRACFGGAEEQRACGASQETRGHAADEHALPQVSSGAPRHEQVGVDGCGVREQLVGGRAYQHRGAEANGRRRVGDVRLLLEQLGDAAAMRVAPCLVGRLSAIPRRHDVRQRHGRAVVHQRQRGARGPQRRGVKPQLRTRDWARCPEATEAERGRGGAWARRLAELRTSARGVVQADMYIPPRGVEPTITVPRQRPATSRMAHPGRRIRKRLPAEPAHPPARPARWWRFPSATR